MKKLVFAALASSVIGSAWAHSFYPWECCSELDCYPVPVARELVERTPDGWLLLKERVVIPFNATRPSPDGVFHICRNEMGKGRIIIPDGKPACLWVPEGNG